MSNPKASAMQRAVSVARSITDSDLDADTLELLNSGLAVDQRIANGDLRPEDVDTEITTGIIEMYETIERGNPFWAAHLRITEAVLEALTPEERQQLWARTEWADVVDSSAPQLVTPAPSETLTTDQTDAGVVGPPSPQSGAEAESDADATEVVDAEIIEDVETTGLVMTGQTTSAQRRYNVGEGGYAPGNNPLARRIGGGNRPQITVNGEAAGWS